MTNEKYTLDNIQEFYDSMENSLNPKIRKMMVYAGYIRDEERRQKEQSFIPRYEYPGCVYSVHLVTDEIAVIEEVKGNETLGYYACVGKYTSNWVWETLEEALLCALSIKFTGNEEATKYLKKLLK